MAGRIRSIKPEILEDEKSAGLSLVAWRLWVSSWTLADDHGGARADAAWLRAQVFWHPAHAAVDVAAVAGALAELAAVGLIVAYDVRGQRYMQTVNWSKHQRVDHPAKPRIPRFDDPDAAPYGGPRETLASPREELAGLTETLAPDLRSPITDLDHRSGPGSGAGPARVHDPCAPDTAPPAAVPVPQPATPDRQLAELEEHAIARLNAGRSALDPSSPPLGLFGGVPGQQLRDHLRVIDRTRRGESLDRALDVLIAEANAGKGVGHLRLGMLAGPNSWPRLLAESVDNVRRGNARTRDGPTTKTPAGRQFTPPSTGSYPDDEQPL